MKLLTLGLDDLFNKQLEYYAKVQVAQDADDAFSLLTKDYEFDAVVVLQERTIPKFPVHMRHKGIDTPLVMLSGIDDAVLRVDALVQGADQALIVPIDIHLLLAFLEALIRRCQGRAESEIKIGSLRLDVHNRRLCQENGSQIRLTPIEYEIFEYLATHNGLCSKECVYEHIYGQRVDPPDMKIMDVFILRIRQKVRPFIGEMLQTKWGEGWYLANEGQEMKSILPRGMAVSKRERRA